MESNILESTGLSSNEASLYLALLKLGESTAVSLAKESSLHRRTVYDTLDQLKKKGLAFSKIKQSKQYFGAAPPTVLREILAEKTAQLQSLLPQLLRLSNAPSKKVSVQLYEGVGGLKTVLYDIYEECRRTGGEYLAIGAGLKAPRLLPFVLPHFLEKLAQIQARLLEPDFEWIRKEIASWKIPLEVRYLPKKSFTPLSISVYSDRTIIMLLEDHCEPIFIQINGQNYANGVRTYFELLWNIAKV